MCFQGLISLLMRCCVLDRRMQRYTNSSSFIQAAQAALNPDGKSSLHESFAAFDQIGTSLHDIVIFWKDQIEGLDAILPKSEMKRSPPMDEIATSAHKWRLTHVPLLAAISSISESSDAVTVNASSSKPRELLRTRRAMSVPVGSSPAVPSIMQAPPRRCDPSSKPPIAIISTTTKETQNVEPPEEATAVPTKPTDRGRASSSDDARYAKPPPRSTIRRLLRSTMRFFGICDDG